MLRLMFVFLLLKHPLSWCSLNGRSCFWRIKQEGDSDRDDRNDCVFILYTSLDYYPPKVAFYFPLDLNLTSRKYQHALTLMFATEEINRNPDLLPNASFEFGFISGSCDRDYSLNSYLNEAAERAYTVPNYMCYATKCEVLFTGPSWKTSARLATHTQFNNLLQMAYGSFHPILSDRDNFPYLYQMAPKDTFLPLAMVSLMIHFEWTWVGLVISDDDQSIQFLSDLRVHMQNSGVCLAFVNEIPDNMNSYQAKSAKYYNQIMTSSANVIIVFGDINSVLEVNIRRWEYLGIWGIWVSTSQWNIGTRKRTSTLDSFHGHFTFSHHHGEISGLKDYIPKWNVATEPRDIFLSRLGWMHFNCSLSESECETPSNCFSNTSLEWLPQHTFDMALNDECYDLYNAMYAVVHARHQMMLQHLDIHPEDYDTESMITCLQIHTFLKKLHFTNPVGDTVILNQKQHLDADYDILVNWNFPKGLGLKVKLGEFSSYVPNGQQLHLYEDLMEWAMGDVQIPSSLCSVPCKPGLRKFHLEGKAPCCFECSPCPENEISNATVPQSIGIERQEDIQFRKSSHIFSAFGSGVILCGMDECVKCADDHYPNIEQTHCLPRSMSFLAYEDPLGMALAVMALGFSAVTAFVLGVFLKHRDTPIVKANNRALSYILLISLIFCFLCSLLFIGHPNTVTCILQQITFGVVFTVAVSTVLAKTITVILAFKLTAPGRKMRWLLVSGAANYIIPICTLVQLIFCGVWLVTCPPFIDTDIHSEHGHIIIMCNKGSVTAFYCVLGYLGSLALGSFTVAFLARNLPGTFNEAKFLTFSMLVFCSVWVTFLPVYHSTKGKVMVAVEVFCILASCAGLVGGIFVPKCYVVLLRPDRNSLQKFKN